MNGCTNDQKSIPPTDCELPREENVSTVSGDWQSTGWGTQGNRPHGGAKEHSCLRVQHGWSGQRGTGSQTLGSLGSVSVKSFRFMLVGPLKSIAKIYILCFVDSKMPSILRYSIILCATKKNHSN